MATMKAVVFSEHGGPEVLRWEEVPRPEPGPGEVLVEIKAAGINHLDLWTRMGVPGVEPMPHIPGNDGAGLVAEVGPGVSQVEVGMECVVAPAIPGPWTLERLRGDENLGKGYQILGYSTQGTHAEFVLVPEVCIIPKPDNLSWEEAGSYALTFLTAWHMLGPKRADLRPGEGVLIIGAGSGVGSAAIQIARLLGADPIITTAGKEFEKKKKLALELGATHVINHLEEEISQRVKEITGGRGVEVVFEHVGPAVFEECILALRRGGRLVTCGATTGPTVELDLRHVFFRHLTIYGSMMGSQAELLEATRFIAEGRLRPVVDRTFPMSQAAEAHRYIEERRQFGKVVLVPG